MKEIDLGYNSKCLKCGKQLCSCEFRQTKTWQEEKIKHTAEHLGIISEGALNTLVLEIRKQDEEELIKMFTDGWKFGFESDEFKKMIQNYYAK